MRLRLRGPSRFRLIPREARATWRDALDRCTIGRLAVSLRARSGRRVPRAARAAALPARSSGRGTCATSGTTVRRAARSAQSTASRALAALLRGGGCGRVASSLRVAPRRVDRIAQRPRDDAPSRTLARCIRALRLCGATVAHARGRFTHAVTTSERRAVVRTTHAAPHDPEGRSAPVTAPRVSRACRTVAGSCGGTTARAGPPQFDAHGMRPAPYVVLHA